MADIDPTLAQHLDEARAAFRLLEGAFMRLEASALALSEALNSLAPRLPDEDDEPHASAVDIDLRRLLGIGGAAPPGLTFADPDE